MQACILQAPEAAHGCAKGFGQHPVGHLVKRGGLLPYTERSADSPGRRRRRLCINHMLSAKRCCVFCRRDAEQAFVFPVELRRAFVTHLCRGYGGVEPVLDHKGSRPVQADILDILQGRGIGHRLEAAVKCGAAHARLFCQLFDVKIIAVRLMDLPQYLCDLEKTPVAVSKGLQDLPLFALQHPVDNFSFNHRRQHLFVMRVGDCL